MKPISAISTILLCTSITTLQAEQTTFQTNAEWTKATKSLSNASLKDGVITPDNQKEYSFTSNLQTFETPRKAQSLTLTQPTTHWSNWQRVPNIGPENQSDAPILLPITDNNIWYFAKTAENLNPTKNRDRTYHAWHSTDMENWVHKGSVAPNWATTAEYKDGKIFIYYDKPNDGKPHLVVGSNLDTKNPTWENKGLAFDDPFFGSDAGVIRASDNVLHLFSEDWSPINARKHSWDSPLATHSTSPDGTTPFTISKAPAPIDERTKPTGKKEKYKHPNFPAEYEVHTPEQNAYGDWAAIQIGNQFYLASDFHPAGKPIRGAIFNSSSINTKFNRIGQFGDTHPDPDIAFAKGSFYIVQQRAKYDLISTGPWHHSVTARAGVDTDNDGTIDQWTKWQKIEETYTKRPNFARVVDTTAATLDLTELPKGYGFQFEFKCEGAPLKNLDPHSNANPPAIDSASLSFK